MDEKKPWRDIYKSPWYPRDGGVPLREIPEHVREQVTKERERSGGGRYVLSRCVGARGPDYGSDSPDYPDPGIVWVEFRSGADKAGERGGGRGQPKAQHQFLTTIV